jgi:rod shape-determining protein MreC
MQFVVAFILSIALMAADHYGHLLGSVRSALLTTLNPIEHIAQIPSQLYDTVTQDFTSLDELRQENQKLKTELLLIKAKMQQHANMELEIERLQALLGTTGKIRNQNVQIATITFFSSNPLSQFLTLNKGQLDNVQPHQVVIDDQGIMGQIIDTTPTSSRVLLISDPDHQLPARIQRTGQRGILTGTGHDQLTLRFIPKNSSLQIGDIIESSGMGGVFPEGYPAAKITQINELKEEPYLEVLAEPIAKLRQAHKVLILSKQEAAND